MGYPYISRYPVETFITTDERTASMGCWEHTGVCLGKAGFRSWIDRQPLEHPNEIIGYRESGSHYIHRV